jgi:hypothetical protein
LNSGGDIPYANDNTRCFGEASGWTAFSKLKVQESGFLSSFYCVDSTGRSVVFEEDDANYLFLGGLEAGERCP